MTRPPISGPAATAIAPADITKAEGPGPFRGGEVGSDQSDDGGQDQYGAHALQERPPEDQDADVRGQ